MSVVIPAMRQGGNVKLTTDAGGSAFTPFPTAVAKRIVLINHTGVTIEWCQDNDTANSALMYDGEYFEIYGVDDPKRISVRRSDLSTTQVTVKARWEN